MAKGYPLQNSFQAGEVSPRLLIRSDVELLRNALYRMENMIPDSRGPARSRPGSINLDTIDGLTNGRIVPFQRREDIFTVVTLTENEVRINEGVGYAGPGSNTVTNPRFDDGPTGWDALEANTGTVTFPPGFCLLQTRQGPFDEAAIQQAVTTTPSVLHNFVVDRTSSGIVYPEWPLRCRVSSTAAHDGDLLDVTTTNLVFTGEFDPGVLAQVFIEIRFIGTETETQETRIDGVSVHPSVGTTITFPSPWNFTDLQTIHYAMPPGGNVMYFVNQRIPPQKLTYDPGTEQWTFAPVVFIGAPDEWVNENYPGTVTFYQGRSYWGGAPEQPETFNASRSGAYEDLSLGDALDDDGIQFTLSARGEIRWMLGVRTLLIGTENGEHVCSADQGIITPGDIKVEQQSAYGSSKMQPQKLGNEAIYISADRKKMRRIGFEWDADAWTSQDITFLAEHMGTDRLRRPVWAQNPDNLLCMPTESGDPVHNTFEITENVIGFFRAPQWGGVIDMCVCETRDSSRLFLLRAARMNDGTDRLFIDTWQPGVAIQMDTSIMQSYSTPTTTVTGLDILEGEVVDVIADGAVHPQRGVVGGTIELQQAATDVVVGKQFTPLLETLPVSDMAQFGSVIKFYKRKNAIFVRVLESSIPYINGQQPANRTPSTPMDTREPDRTADYYVTNLGHDRWSMVEVTQPDPVPLTVLGLFGDEGASSL